MTTPQPRPGFVASPSPPLSSDDADQRGPRGRRWTPTVVEESIGAVEGCIYVMVGVMLVAAALSIVAGTTTEAIGSLVEASAIDTGVLVLDRILLLFIIAELLFTLRLTISRGEILVEPFLFIGLIAVVRRVLVITAESEGAATGGRMLTNFLLELGVLALLALTLSAAIHLLRRSVRATDALP